MTIPNVNPFAPAVRAATKGKFAIDGPSGSGKTEGALAIATAIVARYGGKIALLDTEPLGDDAGAASLYANRYTFDTLLVSPANPATLQSNVDAAIAFGYTVLIVDTISKGWQDVLDRKEQHELNTPGANRFALWGKYGPEWDRLVAKLVKANIHVIVTMRSKQTYLQNETTRKVEKLGLQPQVRDGAEYEFSIVFSVNTAHKTIVSKGRAVPWDVGSEVIDLKDPKVHQQLLDWMQTGGERTAPTPVARTVTDDELTQASIPFRAGKTSPHRGKPLNQVPTDALTQARSFYTAHPEGIPPAYIEAIDAVLEDRRLGGDPLASTSSAESAKPSHTPTTEPPTSDGPSKEGEQRHPPTQATSSSVSSVDPAGADASSTAAPGPTPTSSKDTRTIPQVDAPPSAGVHPKGMAREILSNADRETPLGMALIQLRHILDADVFPHRAREHFADRLVTGGANVTKVRNMVAIASAVLRIGELLATPQGKALAPEIDPRWAEEDFYKMDKLETALSALRSIVPATQDTHAKAT